MNKTYYCVVAAWVMCCTQISAGIVFQPHYFTTTEPTSGSAVFFDSEHTIHEYVATHEDDRVSAVTDTDTLI